MCKIVIHTADTGDHFHDRVNAGRPKPGDIIDILEDDHVFGRLDLGLHNKLVSLPNIKRAEIEHLVSSHPGRRFTGERMHPKYRTWYIPGWGQLLPTDASDAESFLKVVKQR